MANPKKPQRRTRPAAGNRGGVSTASSVKKAWRSRLQGLQHAPPVHVRAREKSGLVAPRVHAGAISGRSLWRSNGLARSHCFRTAAARGLPGSMIGRYLVKSRFPEFGKATAATVAMGLCMAFFPWPGGTHPVSGPASRLLWCERGVRHGVGRWRYRALLSMWAWAWSAVALMFLLSSAWGCVLGERPSDRWSFGKTSRLDRRRGALVALVLWGVTLWQVLVWI